MATTTQKNRTQQQRNGWIRLIRQLLAQANDEQLREIYLLLRGYLSHKEK